MDELPFAADEVRSYAIPPALRQGFTEFRIWVPEYAGGTVFTMAEFSMTEASAAPASAWLGGSLQCKATSCGAPPPVDDTSEFYCTGYATGQYCSASCREGYYLNRGVTEYECGSVTPGVWQSTQPGNAAALNCLPIQCGSFLQHIGNDPARGAACTGSQSAEPGCSAELACGSSTQPNLKTCGVGGCRPGYYGNIATGSYTCTEGANNRGFWTADGTALSCSITSECSSTQQTAQEATPTSDRICR